MLFPPASTRHDDRSLWLVLGSAAAVVAVVAGGLVFVARRADDGVIVPSAVAPTIATDPPTSAPPVVYGIGNAACSEDNQAVPRGRRFVAIALEGSRAGEVLAYTEIGSLTYLELPPMTFGHGSNGIIDRVRNVNMPVFGYVSELLAESGWSGDPPPLLTIDRENRPGDGGDWDVVASDVWGTVLLRRTSDSVELALLDDALANATAPEPTPTTPPPDPAALAVPNRCLGDSNCTQLANTENGHLVACGPVDDKFRVFDSTAANPDRARRGRSAPVRQR